MKKAVLLVLLLALIVSLSGCLDMLPAGEDDGQPRWQYECDDGTWADSLDACKSDGDSGTGDTPFGGPTGGSGTGGTVELEDCGATGLLEGTIHTDEIVEDAAFICLGEKLLADCSPAKVKFSITGVEEMWFEVKGNEGFDCIFVMRYGSEDKITLETHKIYADTFLECPLDMQERIEAYGGQETADETPGMFAFTIYTYVAMNSLSEDTACTGTMLEVGAPVAT